MIRTSNLSYSFNEQASLVYQDWNVENAQHGLILGASGSGKTTLLHLLSGLLKIETGSVKLGGVELKDLSTSEIDHFRGENIGLVFQKPHLISALSVRENISLAVFLGRKKDQSERIDELLISLGLQELSKRKIHEISQGQAQRVSIARALVNKPKVIFGDEPTASLDDESCEKVITLLQQQAENYGATLVLATHDHRVKSHFSNKLIL
ncbi:MAG: ATP-binding cassette domain-containing protein [Cyclobacteriaceae bacterium]